MSLPAIQILDNFASLQTLLDQHAAALPGQTPADVFGSLAWLETLAACGLDDANLDQTACQWWLAGDWRSGPVVGLPVLSGPRLTGLSNYYSSLFAPLVWVAGALGSGAETQPGPAHWQALAQAIRRHSRRWPVLMFDPLDPQSAFFTGFQVALRQAGYVVDRYFCFGNWYLQVAGRGFASYSETLPSALRHSIARGQRRLTRQGHWQVAIQQLPDAGLEGAIANFVAVYEKSWKGPEPNRQFIPALARMAAAQGWLRLGVLQLDGQPIAAQLWLVTAGKANIFKLAYVEGFERFSPGSVLTAALMQHVIDTDLVQEVDYLTGDDAYKRDWMSHRRERWGLVAFDARTAGGLWAGLRHWVGKKLR